MTDMSDDFLETIFNIKFIDSQNLYLQKREINSLFPKYTKSNREIIILFQAKIEKSLFIISYSNQH